MEGAVYPEMRLADVAAALALRNAVFVDDPPAGPTEADLEADVIPG